MARRTIFLSHFRQDKAPSASLVTSSGINSLAATEPAWLCLFCSENTRLDVTVQVRFSFYIWAQREILGSRREGIFWLKVDKIRSYSISLISEVFLRARGWILYVLSVLPYKIFNILKYVFWIVTAHNQIGL